MGDYVLTFHWLSTRYLHPFFTNRDDLSSGVFYEVRVEIIGSLGIGRKGYFDGIRKVHPSRGQLIMEDIVT